MSDEKREYSRREIAYALSALPLAWEEHVSAHVNALNARDQAMEARRQYVQAAQSDESLRVRARAATDSYQVALKATRRAGLAGLSVMRQRLGELLERSEALERECRTADAHLAPYELQVLETDELVTECARIERACQGRVAALKWIARQPVRQAARLKGRQRESKDKEQRVNLGSVLCR
jgi:hypothetical protein